MTTEVLGSTSFIVTPTVSGNPVVLTDGTLPLFFAGSTASRPAAGTLGRVYLDTTLNQFYRDNGASWDSLSPLITLTAVANQTSITQATSSTPAIIGLAADAVLPGNAGVTLPTGSTAQRPAAPNTSQTRWNSTLGYTEQYNGANWVPLGHVLQVVTGTIAATTGTSSIPVDNTTPLITEGTAIWSTSFTPLSAASRVLISFTITHSNSNTANANTVSLFYGTALIGAAMDRVVANNAPGSLALSAVYAPGSTATVTIQARMGGASSTTWYCNQTSTATLGGAAVTEYTITEVL